MSIAFVISCILLVLYPCEIESGPQASTEEGIIALMFYCILVLS